MLYAHLFLGRYQTGFTAYNALQARLLRRYLARGGTLDGWCTRIAPAFRARYGWMLAAGQPPGERAA
jgi:hypothetical protein